MYSSNVLVWFISNNAIPVPHYDAVWKLKYYNKIYVGLSERLNISSGFFFQIKLFRENCTLTLHLKRSGGVPDTSTSNNDYTKRLQSGGLCGGIGAKRLSSFWPSEEASWGSQIPKYCETARSYFTAIAFAKVQNAMLKACIHGQHVVTNAWSFRVNMWKSKQ